MLFPLALMKPERQFGNELKRDGYSRRIILNVTILLLLFLVASLSTLAKNSQYLPKSNPARFVNIASKMKLAQSPVAFDWTPLHPIARAVPPRPTNRPSDRVELENPSIQSMVFTFLLQYRSPPVSIL